MSTLGCGLHGMAHMSVLLSADSSFFSLSNDIRLIVTMRS